MTVVARNVALQGCVHKAGNGKEDEIDEETASIWRLSHRSAKPELFYGAPKTPLQLLGEH